MQKLVQIQIFTTLPSQHESFYHCALFTRQGQKSKCSVTHSPLCMYFNTHLEQHLLWPQTFNKCEIICPVSLKNWIKICLLSRERRWLLLRSCHQVWTLSKTNLLIGLSAQILAIQCFPVCWTPKYLGLVFLWQSLRFYCLKQLQVHMVLYHLSHRWYPVLTIQWIIPFQNTYSLVGHLKIVI